MGVQSCSKSSGTAATGGTSGTGGTGGTTVATVDMSGMSYNPATITIKLGTSVKWNNSDYYSVHTATSDDGSTFNTGNIASGSSYTFTPAVVGTFPYHCLIHGTAMAGTLIVAN
jgi:plastocyanin